MTWRLNRSERLHRRGVASALQERILELAHVDEIAGVHPPFEGQRIAVVLPEAGGALDERSLAGIRGMRALFEQNRRMLEAELGGEFFFTATDPGSGPRWLIGPVEHSPGLQRLGVGPAEHPELRLDRRRGLLIANAPSVHRIFEAFSLLRNLCREEGDALSTSESATIESAALRVAQEVADTWPSFERCGLDWLEICLRHADRVASARDPRGAIQVWLAELGDAHTWLPSVVSQAAPAFTAIIRDGEAILTRVPEGCPAWCAGARPGDRLLGEPADEWWRRTAATLHQKPRLAALRMLQGPAGTLRAFEAVKPDGRRIAWQEQLGAEPREPLIASHSLPSGAGYLRVGAWVPGAENEAELDEALENFSGAPGLIVDLRGNTGGNGQMACAFRDRFLRAETHMGDLQFSEPGGRLGRKVAIEALPARAGRRWNGQVRFLTDPLTYSAAENTLLGLQGLAHVQVLGERSGGGSGQARRIPIFRDAVLTVSSCLSFDRNGSCIEGAGIPVDRHIPMGDDFEEWTGRLMVAADTSW